MTISVGMPAATADIDYSSDILLQVQHPRNGMKMNAKGFGGIAVLITVALVLAVGGATYYFSQQNRQAVDNQPVEPADGPVDTKTATDPATFSELFTLQDSLSCEISSTTEPMMQGTVYIAGDKMRGSFEQQHNGGVTIFNVLRNGTTGYTWEEGSTEGLQLTFDNPEELFEAQSTPDAPSNSNRTLDDSSVKIQCQPWDEQDEMFDVPSAITFLTISQHMEQSQDVVTTNQNGGTDDACTACEQVPDPAARAQCQSLLGC